MLRRDADQPDALARPVRMRDVAERSSVSVSTVSRVLNNDLTVAASSRERVMAAVTELGYRPNRLASNLRRQQMDAVGIVVPDIENPHFAEIVRTIEADVVTLGHRVLVCNTDEDPDRQAACLSMLADERVSGIVLTPTDPASDLSQLHNLRIPVVAIDRALKDSATDVVVADNVPAVRDATQRLIRAGHSKIAFVGGPPKIETGGDRQEGYLEAMAAARLRPVLVGGGFRREDARTAVGDLLSGSPSVTAMVVANNLMALGALKAIREHGLRVPDDLAVIAVDNPPWAELLDPPLTVLAQPIRTMASLAIELLRRRMHGGQDSPPVRVTIPLELIVRGSCGTA